MNSDDLGLIISPTAYQLGAAATEFISQTSMSSSVKWAQLQKPTLQFVIKNKQGNALKHWGFQGGVLVVKKLPRCAGTQEAWV